MKIAAIDIGSNSIHLVIVRAEPGQRLQIIDREKEMARLASKTLRTHRLSEETIDRAVVTLRRFKQLSEANGADLVIATATSAVRESSNAREFIEAVAKQVGLEVQVLPGVEEARLIALAVSEVTEFDNRRALIIDIGGGSTEFIITGGGTPELLLSAKLGAVRLTEQFVTTDPVPDREYQQMKAHIRAELARIMWEVKKTGYDFVIGTSGTILNLINAVAQAKAGKERTDDLSFHPFSQTAATKQLKKLNRRLISMNMKERGLFPGLDKGRADIIVAGGLLLETILAELGAEQITSCDWSLREGVILNYIRRRDEGEGKTTAEAGLHSSQGEARPDVRTSSVLNVARRYNYDAIHSHHIARLAAQIFDETHRLHELGDEERRLLKYAGLLHDIGYYISHDEHHRHGLYLIKNSEMPGFNSHEIAIIANLVRYTKGEVPAKDADARSRRKHEDYFALDRPHRLAVQKLAAILRIADALDRSRRQAVKAVRCQQVRSGVTFHAQCEGEGDLELWMADRKADLFRDVFRLSVKFEPDRSA
jgi:exopolyphosphatase / guanosine-5'-triphosphate,3'-diphosphate pyrophosphatase